MLALFTFSANAEYKGWEYVYCNSLAGQKFANVFGVECLLDSSGYIYELGIADYVHDSYTDYDIVLAKFDSTGAILGDLIISRNANSSDVPITMRINKETGRIYVLSNCTPKDSDSFAIVYCFDTFFNLLWTNEYKIATGNNLLANDLAIDAAGSIIFTGSYSTATKGKNIFIRKINSSGGSPKNKIYNNNNALTDEEAFRIVCNADTSFFILGYQVKPNKGKEFLLIKYNKAYQKVFQAPFNQNISAANDDIPEDLVISPAGDIYVTGRSFINTGFQAVTVKYNSAGVKQWANVYAPSSTGNQLIFSEGMIYVSCDSFNVIGYNEAGQLLKVMTSNGVAIHDFKLDVNKQLLAAGKTDTTYLGVNSYQGYMTRWDTAGNQQYEKMLPAFYHNGIGYASEYFKIVPIQKGWYIVGKRYNFNATRRGYCMKLQIYTYQPLRIAESEQQEITLSAFPNPASTQVKIQMNTNNATKAELTVFDLSGRCIKTFMFDNVQQPASELLWNLTDENGNQAGNGVYLVKLKTDSDLKTIKILVNR